MKVIVYVEGKSDKLAMESLLKDLIDNQEIQGIKIEFFAAKGSDNQRGGNAKKELLEVIPKKAISILQNDCQAIVVVIPDLYPKNIGFPHTTYDELKEGIINQFEQELTKKAIEDHRLKQRFKVFCYKHDLEALVLASENQLRNRLGLKKEQNFLISWTIPVEEQNHDQPPSRIVERLFKAYNKTYQKTVDSALILGQANYQDIAERCPQCFKPFVEFLENLSLPQEDL
ncbi:conserved hypothetical protein [Planktothrix serta PCC 8927]|uniref:DUF4276 family protein n=1 Tax=Planktothrix serta PCC 8927 TaxID=671068 RepID=A0A7Z9E0A4_9CYAN|nr:DUF4276 family protein [Planktothrix serta]VXD19332.1 conserved hypothetical protein [Planktothrix serta PCC 8927]